MMVHIENSDLLQAYVLIGITINEALIERLDQSQLPRNWRSAVPSMSLRAIGDKWAADQTSVALRVPSALVPAENNFLLNPAHADFQKLVIADPIDFAFDDRLA